MALDVLLIGAGQRGRHVYGAYAQRHPDRMRIVGVVEPDDARRRRLADILEIPKPHRYRTVEEVAVGAPAWIVASGDRHHLAPVLAGLAAGADVLVEKPMAPSYAESVQMVEAARAADRQLHVAHVLRYTPLFSALNRIVRSGRIGDIVTVVHREDIAYWHMAHSFVRGNWGVTEAATPMIVQKCCHDFDLLEWNADSPVRRLHSFGSLTHFRPDNAPLGATERCTDGCPAAGTCDYDASRIYLNPAWTDWPVHAVTDDLSRDGRLEALRRGPYGRCVYHSGSDVVDHQVVTMERHDGSVWTLVMQGHAAREARTMRYDGTHATLRARFGRDPMIEIERRGAAEVERVPVPAGSGGHGGGDTGLIDAFVAAVAGGHQSRTTGDVSLESHLLAFAAEESRVTGRVIDIEARRRHVRMPG